MSDNAPLSMESAVSMMIEKNSATPSPEAKTPPPEAAAPEKTDSTPPDDKVEAEAAPVEGEQNTPAEDQGDVSDEGKEPGDTLPPIEAPSFWKAEDKAAFKDLPRAAQEIIHRREQERDAEVRKLQNGSAEQRKAADAEVNRLKGLAEQVTSHLSDQIAELARAFPEIRSDADVVKLAQENPGRYTEFQARLMQFQVKQQAAQRVQQELSTRAEAEQKEALGKQKDALLEAFPKWKADLQVARKEITELQDYAISLGAGEQTARQAFDPVVYKMAQKAMLWDKAQKAKAEALTNTPPRTVKPGPSQSTGRAEGKAQARQQQLAKLDKSGAFEDAVGLLRM